VTPLLALRRKVKGKGKNLKARTLVGATVCRSFFFAFFSLL
jgi:hypothetical protein